MFTIKSDHGLSEAGYDRIVEYVKNILLEGNRLKENFYVAKSMMKLLSLTCVQTSAYCTTFKMQS